MLTNPSERVISALAALRSDTEWQEVVGWLRENAKTLMLRLTETKDDITLRQEQGAAQTLAQILELDEKSMDLVHKMRTRGQK